MKPKSIRRKPLVTGADEADAQRRRRAFEEPIFESPATLDGVVQDEDHHDHDDHGVDDGVLEIAAPPLGRGLYCNRTLNLRSIKVVGFDMDYTLVQYHWIDWERRAYEHLKMRLAADGVPVADLEFDPHLVARGIVLDTELGNLVKANRFGYVKTAYHGTQRMSYEALRDTYMREIVDLSLPRYGFLNTMFSLSEGCMYAQLVDRLDAGELGDALGYHDLYGVVREHIDETHTLGELKAEIMRDPDRFVDLDPDVVAALLDLREAGKRLVLITNSEWEYTAAMMEHAFTPFLSKGTSWRRLFEFVVVAARKPAFFETSAPLLEVVSDDGLLRPHLGPLREHGCYFGGSASLIERHLGVSSDEILYLGDHMYGDVLVTKNVLRWRTGLIIRELEDELRAVEETHEQQAQLADLMREKETLEYEYCQLRLGQLRRRRGYGKQSPLSDEQLAGRAGRIRRRIMALDERIAPLAVHAGEAHSTRWGLLMRAGNDKSQLARQIERYADVYTSRVSNLLYATPFAYLRSRRGSLPHDPLHYMNPLRPNE
jgi:5'-nucleotidase